MTITPGQMEVGKVYNVVYVGPNEAYKRINGKETLLVVSVKPHLQAVQLFDQFGYPFSEDLRGGVVTYTHPELAFQDQDKEITPAPDKNDWFIHSVRVASLEEAIEIGLARERVAGIRDPSGFAMAYSGRTGEHLGFVARIGVEDKIPARPLLQTVFVHWPTWKAMAADFARYA